MSSRVSFTVAVFYETGRLKASLQCQTFLGSIIWWNYWDGDLVKRLVTRWRADGARVWSRDCYLVHHNPLLQFLLLLLLFLPPWQIGAVDKLELSTSALRQQQAATRLRCDQIRTDQNRSEQMWPDQAHARPRRPKYRLENNSTRSMRWNPRLWKHICQLQHISPAFALIECASCLISAAYFDVPILAQTVSCSVNIYETNGKKQSFAYFESLKGLWEHGHTLDPFHQGR